MKTPRFWQTNTLVSTALLPASLIYSIAAWADRHFTKPQRASIPVISVGNITAGGAGKTPTSLALIPILRALGHTPHILTRGYGGASLTAHPVHETDNWQRVGDEALLLAKAAPTWVGRDRIASAKAAANAGATILVCDDALQHHALYKDISLLVIDGPYGIGNGQLLPSGPLREPFAAALKRCDAAIIIGNDAQQLAAKISLPTFHAKLTSTIPISTLANGRWLAFAGIGRPEKFFTSLRELGANLTATSSFADHHAYSEANIKQLIAEAAAQKASLITTAKDAVKIPSHLQSHITVLPIDLTFENTQGVQDFLADRLASTPAS